MFVSKTKLRPFPAPKSLFHARRQCSTLSAGDNCTPSTHRSLIPVSDLEADIPNWLTAVRSAEEKKAEELKVLDLREITSFTDFFVICSVSNPRQGQAVCDSIHKDLKDMGELPVSMEGYSSAEWILMDYGDFLVHIFSTSARAYYELERLWRHARTVNLEAPLQHPAPASSAEKPN